MSAVTVLALAGQCCTAAGACFVCAAGWALRRGRHPWRLVAFTLVAGFAGVVTYAAADVLAREWANAEGEACLGILMCLAWREARKREHASRPGS